MSLIVADWKQSQLQPSVVAEEGICHTLGHLHGRALCTVKMQFTCATLQDFSLFALSGKLTFLHTSYR